MIKIIAMVLGCAGGLVTVACSTLIPQLTPVDDPYKRIAYGNIGFMVGTVFAFVALGGYWYFWRESFPSFGIPFCLAYGVGILVFFLINVKSQNTVSLNQENKVQRAQEQEEPE